MISDFDNPFASMGMIISGPNFIGRRHDLQTIIRRVTHPHASGSIAIIGMPLIGKSSLVDQAIMQQKAELTGKRILPIWLDLALYKEPDLFFRALVKRCWSELEHLGWSTDTLRAAAEYAMKGEFIWETTYHDIQDFFIGVSEANIRVIFVLDEFDHACTLFFENSTRFQGLRELSYHHWGVRWVFISRRTIRDIEQRSRAISNLTGIVLPHHLTMFTLTDLALYFQRLEAIGIPLTDETKDKIEYYCGQHPYLLSIVGYHLLEAHRQGQTGSIDSTIQAMRSSIDDYLERVLDILKKVGDSDSLNKLLQILFGPVLDINQANINLLLSYGLIKTNPEWSSALSTTVPAYVAFSSYFQSFLSIKVQEADVWDVLSETERTLRDLIAEKLRAKYGEERWLENIETKYKPMFDSWQKNKDAAERNWKNKAPRNILSYAYPKELFQVMFSDWREFQPILGKDKNYWDKRAQHLSKVRTPLAHNYAEVMSEQDRLLAQEYCEEILALVRKELQQRDPQ